MQTQPFAQVRVPEQGRVEGGDEGELEGAVVAAVALDEAGPFAELGEAGLEVGLEGEEGGEGVGVGVGEGFGGGRVERSHWGRAASSPRRSNQYLPDELT